MQVRTYSHRGRPVVITAAQTTSSVGRPWMSFEAQSVITSGAHWPMFSSKGDPGVFDTVVNATRATRIIARQRIDAAMAARKKRTLRACSKPS